MRGWDLKLNDSGDVVCAWFAEVFCSVSSVRERVMNIVVMISMLVLLGFCWIGNSLWIVLICTSYCFSSRNIVWGDRGS